ncbi:DUF397 domain-containing protein, partial [Streptomyces sp. SB3404]|nr:DUF397 domain-containing protein [Streptomyces boncukensis]
MPTRLNWHKSSFCAEANNCLEVAPSVWGARPALHLRESDDPSRVLTTT